MSSHEISRREALKAAASMGAAAMTNRAGGQDRPTSVPASQPAARFYYVDGYHGGVDGHMPASSLPNVLKGLDKFPEWKVSFEIEPYSWAVFAKSDPKSIERLTKLVGDASPGGRVELVSGAYGQAYMWNASGESCIRQIAFGLAELRAAFPGVVVDTYAVQEPCWTSCLPGLLKSFGYRRAVLKNSTCWGGYHAPTLDADLINWVGADGTGITTVPRYAIEKLIGPATEAGAQPTAAMINQWNAGGIAEPSGTILQDMGWPGRPWGLGIDAGAKRALRHVTWRQYVQTIAAPATKQWKSSQEDMRVGLPWGGSILQRIAQVVRASENQIVQTEKLASMAFVRNGIAYPGDALKEAWKLLLWSQHHDVWIVSYNRHKGGTWASAVDEKRGLIDTACGRIVNDSTRAMAGRSAATEDKRRFVRVFNTTGFRRRDLASFDVARGKHVRVLDGHGREVASQMLAGTDAMLLFAAEVPSMGYATYALIEADAASVRPREPLVRTTTKPDGTIVLESDLYTIAIDPAKGGRISSLFAKDLNREFVDDTGPRAFNEFRGYFPNEGKWLTSVESPAQVEIVEAGPLRATAVIRGRIGEWPFVTRLSVAAGQRRIDFQTTFDFPPDAPPFGGDRRGAAGERRQQPFRVGEPWEVGHDTVRSNRRPFYDSSFKLQALFPAKLHRPTLDKNAPFDVCRSANADTRFNAWNAIKHNLIMNWVDLLDESGDAGLAVMSDHLTAYSLSAGEPLGMVMCYSGRGIWHDYRLGRKPSVGYAVVPHAGDWAKAQLWRELARWSEPLITGNCAEGGDAEWSLLDASEGGIEVTTALVEEGRLLVRLFNAEGDAGSKRLAFDRRIKRASLVELDGREIEQLPLERAEDGTKIARLAMGRFAVRTVRCEME